MAKDLFLGVDIGTTVVKATIVDASGKIIAEMSKKHNGLHPKNGWHEHDPAIHWWGDFSGLVQNLSSHIGGQARKISSIAVSGIFPTFCPATAKGEPLYNAILYDDARSAEIAYSMKEDLGKILYGNELIPRIIWFRKNQPNLWASTQMIFWVNNYIVYKLTGVYCIDSHNAYVAGGVFDDQTFHWKADKFLKYDISPDILPIVFPPAKIAGYLNQKIAVELGLKSGIPVITGTGDTLLSILGSGAHKKGDVLLNYGSVGVMVRLTRDIQHMLDKGVYLNGESGIENLLILSKYGKQLESLGSLLMGKCFTNQDVNLPLLDQLANKVQLDKENVIFRRYAQAEGTELIMTQNPLSNIIGVKIETTPGEIFRAALESFGFEIKKTLDLLDDKPAFLCANGGGARSKVWRQLVSDIINLPQYFSQESTGAFGNALLAGYATSSIDLSVILNEYLNTSEITTPNYSNKKIYDQLYQRYINS